jgi:hypothetical protein
VGYLRRTDYNPVPEFDASRLVVVCVRWSGGKIEGQVVYITHNVSYMAQDQGPKAFRSPNFKHP